MPDIKAQIIEAAVAEFAEQGLKFKMDDIAKRLSISKKTIYTVFSSKEQLIDEMSLIAYNAIKEKEAEVLKSRLPLAEKIRRVMIALPDAYETLDFRYLSDLRTQYPTIYEKVMYRIESGWEPTLELIRQGMEEGVIRKDISLPVLKALVSSTIQYFCTEGSILIEEGITYADALEHMMDIVMSGILEQK